MLSTEIRSNSNLFHPYQFLTEKDEIDQILNGISGLNIKTIGSNYIGGNPYVVPIYNGDEAVLVLTEIAGIHLSLLCFPDKGEIAVVNFRFHETLYKKNIQIFGDIWTKDGQTYFSIHAIKIPDIERLSTALEQFDQILYTQFVEDTDLEPIKIVIKPFYERIEDMNSNSSIIGALYLNTNINGQHFERLSSK